MEQVQDQDLIKIKELLRHTSEFIAYFELVEKKMMEWQQDMELQIKNQQERAQSQLQYLHHELETLENLLKDSGLTRLRQHSEQLLKQGEAHLLLLQKTSGQLLTDLSAQHHEFSRMVDNSMALMDEHTQLAIEKIDKQLGDYDVQHFRRVANESCEHVEKAAQDALLKSTSMLRTVEWRSIALALLTTLLTAFAISLYVSNEMPWDSHQQAIEERDAGKLLIKAWPSLSPEEKIKILNGDKSLKN